jgi:MinD-like ATPase involved in chromosome partitioning or flagellar assembly
MIVSFWNYLHGRGNTSNCIATASNFALNYKSNSIIIDSEYQKSLMSNAFFNSKDIKALKSLDYGIDSIANIIYAKQKIDNEDFGNYATCIMDGRLCFLPGSSKASKELYNDSLINTMSAILENARQCYDMVFIDVNSGIDNEITKSILLKSDFIFVSLEQNEKILEDFFNSDLKYLKEKDYGIMIGRYDTNCKCSAKYIGKAFNFKGNIFTIPYSTSFLNAINNNKVFDFFYKNNVFIKKKEDSLFFGELDFISDVLYKMAGNKNVFKMPLGDNDILTRIKSIGQI